MKNNNDFFKDLINQSSQGNFESINDLRDKEFSGSHLSTEEINALSNFDTFRIKVLNSQPDKPTFQFHYQKIQIIANLNNWKDFTKNNF